MMKTVAILALMLLIVGAPLAHWRFSQEQTRNLRAVTPGVMYRSGQMTELGLERTLEEYGVRTVISFRDAPNPEKPTPYDFEETLCTNRGVDYHRLTPLKWSSPDGSVPAQANVDRYLKILRDPKTPKPILVHCFAGIHRTGAFVALYRMDREGWSNREAIAEMLEIGGLRHSFENDQVEYLENFRPESRR